MEKNSWFVLNIVTLIFMFANFVGNFLIITVLLKVKTLRVATSYLLLSLAFADISLGISIFGTVVGSLNDRSNTPKNWVRKLKFYVHAIVCVFTLIAIAIERFLAVMKPFYHKVHVTKKWVAKIAFVVWLLSGVFILPGYFLLQPQVRSYNSTLENTTQFDENFIKQHIPDDPMEDVRIGYEVFLVLSFTVLPALVMSTLYGRIIYRVWFQPDTPQGTNLAMVKARRKMTKLLLTVTIAFYLCWLPVLPFMANEIDTEVKNWLILFPLLSTWLNPIIYSFHSASFRQGIRSLCCTCCVSKRVCAENVELGTGVRKETATFSSHHNLNETKPRV